MGKLKYELNPVKIGKEFHFKETRSLRNSSCMLSSIPEIRSANTDNEYDFNHKDGVIGARSTMSPK